MPPQVQDDDIDAFMQKRKATAPKLPSAPKPAPVAGDDVDGFMSRRTGSVSAPTTKKEQLRRSVTGLQNELTATTPQLKSGNTLNVTTGRQYPPPPPPRFQSPIDMRLNAPNEAQKAFDRAAAAVQPAPAQPKPELRTGQTLGQMKRQVRNLRPITQEEILQNPITLEERKASVEAFLAEGEREKQRQQAAAKAKMEEEASRASQSTLGRMGTRFARGVVRGTTQTPFEFVQMVNPDPVVQQTMGRIADESKEWQSQNLPVDNRNPATLNVFKPEFYSLDNASKAATENIPEVLGEMLPQMALARGAGGVARVAPAIPRIAPTTAAEFAEQAAAQLAARKGAELATRTAAGGYGAMQQSTQAYQKALDAGMTPGQAARAAAIEAPIGFSEFLGSPGTTGFTRPGTTIRREMKEEFLQESGQTGASGLAGKYVSGYDAGKSLTDIAGESIGGGLLGAATGGIVATPGARLQARQRANQQRATRSAIDQRSAANAAAITPQPVPAQPVTAPAVTPATSQSLPAVTTPLPQAQPQGLPRLPARELSAQDKFAQAYGAKEPVENRINAMIGNAETLLGSQNENDRKMGERMMNRALTAIRQTEGYLAEAALPPDAERPFTAVRDAIEARLKPAPKVKETPASQVPSSPAGEVAQPTASSALRAEADAAKIKAAEFEQVGDFTQAATIYQAAHQNLKRLRRSMGQPKTPEAVAQINQIDREISIADANRRKANQSARTAQRQANAPTAGLSQNPQSAIRNPQSTEAPLLRPDAVQNPEGGIPQMPEPTFTDRLESAARRDEAARGKEKPAKRLLSRIAELGGISDRYAGELQNVKDARRIGVIRQKADMSPDVLARQLQSEGYDVDPEDLNTLWEAARRDIAGRDERTSGTSELERRLAEEEAAYNERQPFDQIVADVDAEPTNRLRESDYEGGEIQRYSKPLEGQAVEREAFQPDTADLREVREFAKREPRTEQFTEEPPTAPLAQRRQPIRPPAPTSPRPVGNRPLSVDVAGTRTPTAMSPDFPRARREMVKQGREVDARLELGQEKGEFGNVAEAMFKSTTPDVLHGQDSFFHDPDLKGKLGLTRDAEMAEVRRELKTQLARSLGLSAEEVSLSYIKPEVWRAWAKQKGLGREAVRKLEAGIARAERKDNAIKTNAAITAEESQRAQSEVREPAGKAARPAKSVDQQIKDIRDLQAFDLIDDKEARQQIAALEAQRPKIAERRSEAMPERYTGRQLFENAQLTFRPARNRPATLVANDWGGAMLNRLLSEKFDVTTTDANFTIAAKDAKDLRDYLAEAKDSGIYEPAQVANMDALLKQMDAAIADAEANQQDVAFVTRRPAEPISATKAKIRHEAAHLSQSRIAADLSALTGKNWLDSQSNAKDIHKELDRRGYAPETHDYEAAAFVASGDYGVFGMNLDQAAKFLSDYFGAVVEKHGKRALQKFGAIDPKLQPTLEAARRETEAGQTENRRRSSEAAQRNERQIGAASDARRSGASVLARRREGDTGDVGEAGRSPRTRASVENSPEFKRWLGDSKVVDESGKPLVMYHGTQAGFSSFEKTKIGSQFAKSFGFHFSNKPEEASFYSSNPSLSNYDAELDINPGSQVVPVYLRAENPLVIETGESGASVEADLNRADIIHQIVQARRSGKPYDSVIIKRSRGDEGDGWNVIVFEPSQIKSATGNRGTFDPTSPRISEQKSRPARRGQVLASGLGAFQNLFERDAKPKEADTPTKPEPVPTDWNQQKWAKKAMDALVTRDMPKDDREKFFDFSTKKPERLALLQKYMPSEKDIDDLINVIDRANNAIKNNDGDDLREAVWAARAIVERPATNSEKASALMRAAMFSTPRGRMRDLISNFAEQKLASVARIPGSAADAAFTTLRRLLTGEGERTFLGPRPAEYLKNRAADRAKQWKQTKDVWKGKHVDALEDVLQHREVNFDNKFLDKSTKAVFRAMGAADQWFFVKEYQRAIREQAELAARSDVRSGVISKADRQKQTDYYAAAPTTEMKAMAELAAKQMVFRNPNLVSDKIQKFRADLSPGGNFVLDIVMPVDRTPTNIILTALEYSPLGAVKLAGQMATGTVKATAKTLRNRKDLPTRQAIKKALDEAFPPEKQRAMSRLFGRTVTGTSAPVALGFALASAGMATGFYDEDDPGEEAERREEGKMPNSVKIGDRWYELGGIAPLGMLIGLGATLHREMHAKTLDPEKRYARLAKGFGNMAMEIPALESAKQTVKIAKAVTGKPSDLGRIAGNIGARFVPGLVGEIGQATPYLRDPYEREIKAPKSGEKDAASLATKAGREFASEFGARIPGVRRLLPPKMNALTGKPVETEWHDVVDPFRSRKAVEPSSLSGVKAAQMKFDISSEVRPKIGEPDEVFRQRKERVEGWMSEYGDKLLNHPRYSVLTESQQQAAMESLRRRIGTQQNATRPRLDSFAPEKVIQSVLKSEAARPKREAKKLWSPPVR